MGAEENAARERNDRLLAQTMQGPTHHNHHYNGGGFGGFGGFGDGDDDLAAALRMSVAEQAPQKRSQHDNFWTCNASVKRRDLFNNRTVTKACRQCNVMKDDWCKSCDAPKPPQ